MMGAVPTVWLMPGEDMDPRVHAGTEEMNRGYTKPCPTSTYELCKGSATSWGENGVPESSGW